MAKALAPSTLKAYSYAWSLFNLFCIFMHVSVLPVSVPIVCAFIVHCFESHRHKLSTIRGNIAGIQFYARCQDPGSPSLFSAPAIRLLLKGMYKSVPKVPDKRSPITLDILNRLVCALRAGKFHPYFNILLETVFLTAFYGFMRPGEYTSPTQTFSPTRGLAFADVTFFARHFSIFLKRSKSDSLGVGATIIISRINNSLCPYASMLLYLKLRQRTPPESPLFILPNGRPMTKEWFRVHLAKVVEGCGLPSPLYTGHSFRIGAATTAAEQGLPDASIKRLGRWSSTAYESYIRSNSRFFHQAHTMLSYVG